MSFTFLTLEELLYIHQAETSLVSHDSNIRDLSLLKSAVENTKLIYANGYVTDVFELAASYIKSIVNNHPFIDGNKRTALAAAMVFLEYNGFIIKEESEEELADQILDYINKEISQEDLAEHLTKNSTKL
jgi:death-on-curing protein